MRNWRGKAGRKLAEGCRDADGRLVGRRREDGVMQTEGWWEDGGMQYGKDPGQGW